MAHRYPAKAPRAALPLLVLLLLLLRVVRALTLTTSNQTSPRVPALIVFGDSIVDPGNNNALLTLIRCNFPPYGKDFPGHVATGRFSNGRIPSDMLASKLGVKELLPAYLGTELDAHDLLTGVSFASGGAGYDPLTSTLVSAISMSDQLTHFKEYKEKLKAVAGEKKAADIISKSLFVVVMGSDDLANTYFTTPFRRLQYDVPSYVDFLVQSASSFFQELHELGARKMGVAGVPPIGCVPSQRTIAGGLERDCVPLYNRAAVTLNNRLSQELMRLNATFTDTRVVYIDLYYPLLELIRRPSAYGFKETARGCCGTGTFEVTLTCNSLTTSTCENVSNYVFWDSYHPTERAYEVMMDWVLQQYGPSLS